MADDTYDAVVVGAGPNGLVAANRLVDAGWSVLVLEAQPTPGGAVRSDREVHPDFVHDTFSAFYPLAVASRAIRRAAGGARAALGARPGRARPPLRRRAVGGAAPRPRRDGRLSTTRTRRRRRLAGAVPTWDRDRRRSWSRRCSRLPAGARGRPARCRRCAAPAASTPYATLSTPAAGLGRELFGGAPPELLLAGNAGHADIPLDAPGRGSWGADDDARPDRRLPGARGRRRAADRTPWPGGCASLGGGSGARTPVDAVHVDAAARPACAPATGAYAAARRGRRRVGPHLYGRLVAEEDLPARRARHARSSSSTPGTVKVDWALTAGAVGPRRTPPGTVHIADSVEE